jgi:adenylate kinase
MGVRLILFGPPGVGKGTQAKLLAEHFAVPHISTGDMLRAAIASGSPLGKKAKAIMDAGKLVPDDVVTQLVRETLAGPEMARGFILDGFPRTLAQAKELAELFKELAISRYQVINFKVSDDEIVRRLGDRLLCPKEGKIFNVEVDAVEKGGACPSCGTPLTQRDDDTPGTVRERLRVYHASTEPVLQFYKDLGVVITIDGSGSIDVINREIRMML